MSSVDTLSSSPLSFHIDSLDTLGIEWNLKNTISQSLAQVFAVKRSKMKAKIRTIQQRVSIGKQRSHEVQDNFYQNNTKTVDEMTMMLPVVEDTDGSVLGDPLISIGNQKRNKKEMMNILAIVENFQQSLILDNRE